MKTTIKETTKAGYNKTFTIKFENMTEGKMLVLENALREYAEKGSLVGEDVWKSLFKVMSVYK